MCRFRELALGAILLSAFPALAEGAQVMHVTWDELSIVAGRTVRISLPGGLVTGKAKSVETSALAVDVKKTSDPKSYPKGVLRVPREKLHRFEMQSKRRDYRFILTFVGGVLGAFGGGSAACVIDDCTFLGGCRNQRPAAAAAAAVGITAAGVVGGYFAGNAADKRRWRAVEIVP
jgi:hypothetical protein